MSLKIAFVFKNFKEVDETLNCFGKTSKRMDSFELYKKRNKVLELRICEALQIPYFFIIGDPTSLFIEAKTYRTYNMYKDEIISLEDLTFFVRGDTIHEEEVEKYILSKRGKVSVSLEGYDSLKKWFSLVHPRYLNRVTGLHSGEDLTGDSNILIDFTNSQGYFFAKGLQSKKGEILCRNNPEEFPTFMLNEKRIFLSELINIKEEKIDEETVQKIYRVWFINSKPLTYTMLIQHSNNYAIPQEVITFANNFGKSHISIFPPHYSMDIAMDTEGKLYCLTLNPISSSIEYSGINFAILLETLTKNQE